GQEVEAAAGRLAVRDAGEGIDAAPAADDRLARRTRSRGGRGASDRRRRDREPAEAEDAAADRRDDPVFARQAEGIAAGRFEGREPVQHVPESGLAAGTDRDAQLEVDRSRAVPGRNRILLLRDEE